MDSEAAPAAAASANSQVGAGGACEMAPIVCSAAVGGRWPAVTSSIAFMAEATRSMCTPVGLAATSETNLVVPSVASSCNSPQLGMIVARSPRLLLSRSVAANISSVDCPLTCSACPSMRTTSDCSSRFIVDLGCIAGYPDHGPKYLHQGSPQKLGT